MCNGNHHQLVTYVAPLFSTAPSGVYAKEF